jgi:hypothetical protein
MEVRVNAKDVVIVTAVKKMRRIIKSEGSRRDKEKAVNTIFWQLMRVLDEMEGGEE